MSGVFLFYVAIKPSPRRWPVWPQMQAANSLIEEYVTSHDRLFYLDVATPVFDPDGNAHEELYLDDMLHMNDTGYLYG